MTWGGSVPGLVLGLRAGLGAGLALSLLLAAARRAGTPGGGRAAFAPAWLGVLGAVTLSGGFAAVLTFSTSGLPRLAQAVAGLLGVLAACLVTRMIFWTRRVPSGPPAADGGEAGHGAPPSAWTLTITAFLVAGPAGLETALFLWQTVRAPAPAAGPLAAAVAGLAVAIAACRLLYRQAIRLDASVLLRRAGAALIVLAAGMLISGLADLQNAGLLSGRRWIALDLTAHASPGSWWVSISTGVTGLSSRMTMLQVTAWIAYLAVVTAAFVHAGRAGRVAGPEPDGAPAAPATAAAPAGRWERLVSGRALAVAGVMVAVPVLAAGTAIAALPSASAASSGAGVTTTNVTVTSDACALGWAAATAGQHTFTVRNESGKAGEINLDDAFGEVVGEIETIGPGTTAQLTATLTGGRYVFKCYLGGQAVTTSPPVQVARQATAVTAPVAVLPVTLGELTGPNTEYQAYAGQQLAALATEVTVIQADLRGGNLAAAKRDWLTAQLDWERVGASYDSFGPLGLAVDGLPDGLPDGVSDPGFTGLHRLEYGLWHGQSAATLMPVAATLARNVAAVRANLSSDDLAGDPTNLPIRAHEILEDALRDHLSGIDDLGGGAAYAETNADLQVTTVVLQELTPLISARDPGLLPAISVQLNALQQALLATRVNGQWDSLSDVPQPAREDVNSAIGALLETLSSVPDLLEVPPAH